MQMDQKAQATPIPSAYMVEGRTVPGHWEDDLPFGGRNSRVATPVERQTRYVMLVKLAGKVTETVITALIRHACKLPH